MLWCKQSYNWMPDLPAPPPKVEEFLDNFFSITPMSANLESYAPGVSTAGPAAPYNVCLPSNNDKHVCFDSLHL